MPESGDCSEKSERMLDEQKNDRILAVFRKNSCNEGLIIDDQSSHGPVVFAVMINYHKDHQQRKPDGANDNRAPSPPSRAFTGRNRALLVAAQQHFLDAARGLVSDRSKRAKAAQPCDGKRAVIVGVGLRHRRHFPVVESQSNTRE